MHYGIDVGGTKTEFSIFDHDFKRIHSHRTKTPVDDYAAFIRTISELVAGGDASYGKECTIGVGLTGLVDRQGRSFSVNVPCLNGMQVQDDLVAAIGRRVCCINDVRAFALSEARGGAAEGCDTMVGIILGTGAASGTCHNGILNVGANGVAGEWGHLPMAAGLMQRHKLPTFECSCGNTGCAELYVSGPGLARLAQHFINEDVDSAECVARFRQGDSAAGNVINIWIDCVASIVSQLVLHINPDVIVVGGGLSNIDELYGRVPDIAKTMLPATVSPPPIRRAVFGDDSGVRGAAIIGADS
mgnify:CR=1 FL=1